MKKDINKKVIIGFSIGDYNGIGPEILLKSFSSTDLLDYCIPIIFCDKQILDFYAEKFRINIKIKKIKNLKQSFESDCLNTFSENNKTFKITPGYIDKTAGIYAINSLNKSSEALINKNIDSIVTLPICKINSQNKTFSFPGHTEYFLSKFNVDSNIMIMCSDIMKIGFITGHIPINSLLDHLDNKYLEKKLNIFLESIQQDFKIVKPRIAVLGLNPHAGEEGLIGNEEKILIQPIIDKLNIKKEIFYGPFSSDSFFGLKKFKDYDGIISWYHDQGLVGFKSFCFDNGVNFTGGLPYVRTSPDHGTAFNIAGKGIASEKSLIESIKLNIKIINNRKF
mgnify:FL=1|tara:strand:+ start:6582 stop:7592 length:1011 start_codon:yes stop_codon:yes gene_type:complete